MNFIGPYTILSPGSLTFIAASSVFLKWHCQHSIRQYVQTAAVLIWATRSVSLKDLFPHYTWYTNNFLQ